MRFYLTILSIVGILFLTACAGAARPGATPTPGFATAFETVRSLGRGVNMGNALEAPREGEWGMVIQEHHFALIKEAGFDSIRLPVRWSAHAPQEAPYTIEPRFFTRVDEVIGWALQRDLAVVLNIHHYDPPSSNIAANPERLYALWEQIAAHYQDYPPQLVFEILNEPDNTISVSQWNEIAAATLSVIRETNPTRDVIIGGVFWNAYDRVRLLELPENDERLIVTFHYYLPFQFTHQGAEWVENSAPWVGTTWDGSEAKKRAIDMHFKQVATWAEEHNRPIYLGEFGAYSKADMASRAAWTAHVRERAEAYGFAWAYWEFGAGFGVYDRQTQSWREALLRALIP